MGEIVICAARSVTRAGLAAMATTANTQVVGQVSSLLALDNWLRTDRADLALVALTSLGAADIGELGQVVEAVSPEEIVPLLLLLEDGPVLTDWASRRLVLEVLSLGVVSLLPMAVSANRVRAAIAAIFNGLTVLHPDIAEGLWAGSPSANAEALPPLEPLTPREIQVLNQMAGGLSNKAIAQTLDISEHTVKFHISAILSKLGVSGRTEAVAVGIRAGLVML